MPTQPGQGSKVDGPRCRRAELATGESAGDLIARERLFAVDDQGVARLPSLVAGSLVVPVLPDHEAIEQAIALGRRSVDIGDIHLVMADGEVQERRLRCLALPRVSDPALLVPHDIENRIETLDPLACEEIMGFVDAVGSAMSPDGAIVGGALPLAIASSSQPEYFVRLGFADVAAAYDGSQMLRAIDRELAYDGRPGREFLDGWVAIGDAVSNGSMAVARERMGGPTAAVPGRRSVRAVPMSQLHVTAGNSPVVPAISALRAIATKGAMTVKLPADALVAGSAFALALWSADPGHPIVRHASVAYWQGGDESFEDVLFTQSAFERIVVWGSRASVDSVASRAAGTKVLVFNPRYGVSLIGREALTSNSLEATVRRAAQDTMVWNQQACIASLVHYVEGSREDVDRYCDALKDELALWDEEHGYRPGRALVGRIRTARRGELADGKWQVNGPPVAPTSAVVRVDHGFDLSIHPMARVVVVRHVVDIADTMDLLHAGVSSVGVFPAARLHGLRDAICARGVTAALPLGEADTLFTGAPHDGLRPLSELVSWAVS